MGEAVDHFICYLFPFEPLSFTSLSTETTTLPFSLLRNNNNMTGMLQPPAIPSNCLVRKLSTERTGAHRWLHASEHHEPTPVTKAYEQSLSFSFEQH